MNLEVFWDGLWTLSFELTIHGRCSWLMCGLATPHDLFLETLEEAHLLRLIVDDPLEEDEEEGEEDRMEEEMGTG
jgi:hypothetical protein